MFKLCSECLTKEALDGLGDFKVGWQIIQTVKYADDLVLMAKEETVLQGMIDKLIETCRYYDMEINVEKTKVRYLTKKKVYEIEMHSMSTFTNASYRRTGET